MDQDKRVIDIGLVEEMKSSYIDYAMSVIVGRALPDVRDGLKPVHRRILYAMNELSFYPDKPYRKSARIVGDVLGKYHPHGDGALYGAMVRMAQSFSSRHMLIDGHGNFGSVDGDSAAAMRYTEARMSKISLEMVKDINKETIDFVPNFDDTLVEPVVLPSRYPNLLVNGSNGIAVGMATSIPPHNLEEVIDGVIELINNPDAEIEDILKYIKGPDFPTGAAIMGSEGFRQAYMTGRGKVKVRAITDIEERKNGKQQIIVSEIPYQVNKSKLIEKIAHLVRDKKIIGITDLRDESDRTGMRIVIELKRDANANVVLNKLYKHSQMEDTFSIILLSLVGGQPRVLNLKEMLVKYLEFQETVIERRTKFDLKKAEEKAHILEGLKIALDNIDEIIKLIKESKNTTEAKKRLKEEYTLSERQAVAILEMRLQKLTGLERDKIIKEYTETMKLITKLKEILSSEELILKIVKKELIEVREKFKENRRTIIVKDEGDINLEDLIDEEDVAITLTHFGYIKRLPVDTYSSQKRGGRGKSGLKTREEDFVENLLITSSHSSILFFTNKGKVFKLRAYEIPEGKRQAKGTAIVNLLQLSAGEKVKSVIKIDKENDFDFLIMATKKGIIKKTRLEQFENTRKTGLIAISIRDEDELIDVKLTYEKQDIILVTAGGKAIRFKQEQVRATGRGSVGVRGIKIKEDDFAVTMEVAEENKNLLVVSENGYGKKTKMSEYRTQTRGGQGVRTYNVDSKTGKLVGAKAVEEDDDIMLISNEGIIIRLETKGISKMGRSTRGVTLMKTKTEQKIVSLALVPKAEE
ncbi:MAG: DNA gyrase subunit A [Alkaliphilus sp.]|nr:DNA gyrase subunit A [Alkaliphilus transvaalensis]PHS32288.1 MAG: DNA gyrase subunit A [Alkaliphilus sp.]